MKIRFTAQDIAVIAICSALYSVFGLLTALPGLSFYGIRFLPAVVIPAVFAVLYGPWVGGISGAIGIFIQDMIPPGHGIAPLSLVAGVPPNFILFFFIGYLYTKNISLKQAFTCLAVAAVGLLLFSIASITFPSTITAITGVSPDIFLFTSVLTVIVSLIVIAVVSIRWKEWRSYAIGAVVGQIAGCLLLSVTVWVVHPLFLNYFGGPIAAIGVLPLFVWLIVTELPFILLAGPPIIKVVRRAFPALRYQNKTLQEGGTVTQKNS